MAKVVPIALYKQADFTLANLSVRPSLNRVEGSGKTVRLEPKVMKVLVVLWRAGGEVVSRDELIEDVWEGQAVTDDAITRCISRLRRLFSEDFPGDIEIETVQKTGYRLTAGEEKKANKATIGFLALVVIVIVGWISYQNQTRDVADPQVTMAGTPNRPFTTLPGLERNPDFSPDGLYVSFSWFNPEQGDYDIYRMDVSGEGRLQLTSDKGDERWAAWSPDGTEIAFARMDEAGCSIRVMPSIGGPDRKLADCGQGNVLALEWAPDGSRLLAGWREGAFSPGRIFFIDYDTGTRTPIVFPDSVPLGVDDAVFNTDGTALALTLSPTLGVEDIYILRPETGNLTRLTEKNLKVHGLEWTAGDEILTSTNWLGTFGLWAVPVDGTAPRTIRSATSGVDGISVSPAGDILIDEWTERAGAWQLDLATGEMEALPLNSTRFDWDARPSPDGGRTTFVSDRDGAAELWVFDDASDTFSRLTDFGGPWTHSPRWSPDGKTIAFTSPAGGRFDLFLADIESRQIKQLTKGAGNNFAPAWSPDGRYIYFGSDRSGTWNIHRLDIETRADEAVPGAMGRAPQMSPDGQWLYFSKIDEDGLWRMPLDGARGAKKILNDLAPVDWNNWYVLNNAIYYIRRRIPERPELVRLDLADESIRVMHEIPDLLHNSGLWVAHDESRVILTRIEDVNADLVLIGNGR